MISQPYYTQMKMEEDKSKAPSSLWVKHLEHMITQRDKHILKRAMSWKQTPYVVGESIGIDPYDVTEEEKPIAVNMDDYIHKDEMVQILLDSRHAMFNNRIPSVLEVLEWIDQRERKNK